MDKELLKETLINAEKGSVEDRAVIWKLCECNSKDSVEDIQQKKELWMRIFYTGTLEHKDASYHKEIDTAFSEQTHSFIQRGVTLYKFIALIGFRESAKTTRAKMNIAYMACYIPEHLDLINSVSEDVDSSTQFTMDMYNAFAYSKISKYRPNLIEHVIERNRKESKTMKRFSTTDDVTFNATTARKTKRGNQKQESEEGEDITTKRPKLLVFDDIENENTVRSMVDTERIRGVMQAGINGLDQIKGFTILLGNYLSLRGNVHYYINKYRDEAGAKIIMIPIHDSLGNPTWEDKYTRTDKEQLLLAEENIQKVSIETLERDSDNFETEFLNNPQRNSVYFSDEIVNQFNTDTLVKGSKRDTDGLLLVDEYKLNGVYFIFVDTATGIGRDNSAFVIFESNGKTFKEVANFKCNTIKPENFAKYTVNKAREYNNALIVPENNYPANEFITIALQFYKNIYKKEKDEYGVNTNGKTKPEMFNRLKTLFIQELILIQSENLYLEVKEYPASDILINKRDSGGGHFDTLMSCAVGFYVIHDLDTKGDTKELQGIVNSHIDTIFINSNSVR